MGDWLMKKVLVLGGTRFFGRKLVELLVNEGHQVTIMTRGQLEHPFGDKVEHIIGDRVKEEQLQRNFEDRYFDIVYDNICYSSNEAHSFCKVFNGKIGKLVFTSSLSTYEVDGKERKEEDFHPYTYKVVFGDLHDFTYAEGKRQAEAVFFQYAKFPVVAVRLPIVLGTDDYTRRLHFHVEHVQEDKIINFVNSGAEMSFITATEAAEFLKWAGLEEVEGPFNATASGKISLSKLVQLIEDVTGKKANIAINENAEDLSPYAVEKSWYMSNEKATKAGFTFSHLHDWLKPLIKEIASE